MEQTTLELEKQLMPGLLERDAGCFKKLVETYYASMLGLARAIVGEAIADEVVQEAWISIYKALPKFEQRSSLKTWILRITANEAKTRLRKESRTLSLESLSGGGEPVLPGRFNQTGQWQVPPSLWHDENPEALVINQEMGDCINHTLHKLPELQQAVFTLKDLEDRSFDEICNILDVSASNARVLLHRARITLFGKIEHFQETGQC